MLFSLKALRVALMWRLCLILHTKSAQACHSTTVHIQNGTWLNTSPWLRRGFFGHFDYIPLPPQNLSPNFTSTANPVVPNHPVIPNREQDCVCGTVPDQGTANEPLSKYQPWLAKLSISRGDDPPINCSGVLVNARYVVTVARCFCHGILTDCSNQQYPETPHILPLKRAKTGKRGPILVQVGFSSTQNAEGKIIVSEAVGKYDARRVIIYERYNQKTREGDLALVELATAIPNRSLIQPICLPPTDNGFSDVDCHSASPGDPLASLNMAQQRVCHPKDGSRLTAFQSAQGPCQTNGIGPAGKGVNCVQCIHDGLTGPKNYPEDAECEKVYRQLDNRNVQVYVLLNTTGYDGETIRCYPPEKAKDLSHGWCLTQCPSENCPWGGCMPSCQPPSDHPFSVGKTDAYLCSKGGELCSGAPLKKATVVKGSDGQYAVKDIMDLSPSLKDFYCESAGSPLWKEQEFTNSYGMSQPLAVLTGLVSRHEMHCDANAAQLLVHTRIKDVLDWILNHIRGGSCQDLEHLPRLN